MPRLPTRNMPFHHQQSCLHARHGKHMSLILAVLARTLLLFVAMAGCMDVSSCSTTGHWSVTHTHHPQWTAVLLRSAGVCCHHQLYILDSVYSPPFLFSLLAVDAGHPPGSGALLPQGPFSCAQPIAVGGRAGLKPCFEVLVWCCVDICRGTAPDVNPVDTCLAWCFF